jgi:hypothetical protein
MRGIARLLLGDEAGGLSDLFDGAGDADGWDLAGRVSRSGEWCASTPGRGSADAAARGAARPRGLRRELIVSEYDPR